MANKLKDTDPMPDKGKYKGVRMIDIPDPHLKFLYMEGKCSNLVREYIKENVAM